jgi:F-type H+-transporting ATPase subunit b
MNQTDRNRPQVGRQRIGYLILITVLLLSFNIGFALASGGEGEHGAPPKGWVATDTYRVMNFSVLALALFFLLRKPVKQALNGRIQDIKDQLSDLEMQKQKAEKQLADYNERLARLDHEAKEIMETYIQQGHEAKARILKAAEASAEKLEEQAKRNIEHEFQKAKQELHAEILEKALGQAEVIVKAKITDDDQNRLVDEYLEKVVA